MAVFRSDQAQLTFAVEAAQGGDPELIEGTAGTGSTTLSSAHNAGSRTITVASASNFLVGDTIRIGTVAGTASQTVTEHEARKIELIDSTTFVLDRPTAFYHPSSGEVKEITALGGDAVRNDKGKFVSWIPGIYETIDTPDPEMSIEGRRFLNTLSKRNWSVAYPGQQTLTGSVGDMLLLNGWPLRFPIGKVTTVPSAVTGSATLNGAVKKGDVYITLSSSHGVIAGDIIAIYDAANTTNATKTTEVRMAEAIPTTNVIKLNYPLSFDHITGSYVRENNSSTYYEHEIIETTDLDTVSWHVHMLDSAESNTFDRRYVGGMIGSTTITAEEGGMVTMSWDGVNFLNMVHNQKNQTNVVSGSIYTASPSIAHNLPRYGLMQAIDAQDVGMPGQTAATANAGTGFPTTQPYYFSQGTIKYFGTEFARVRSFSLSISNGEEPRYYIGRQGKRARGPYEIREGQREYSMSATISLPDSAATDSTDQGTALELFKQLLLEGDYGAGSKGMACQLRFDRGADDYILIDIPYQHYASGGIAAGAAGSVASAIDAGGLYINTAAHNITSENPMQIDADMIFRNLRIIIRDDEPYYP